MILWRTLPWDPGAGESEPGGPLWFPRRRQGRGRHDDPARYGCLYVTEAAVAAVAEALAPFRGTGPLRADLLRRDGRALAQAAIVLAPAAVLIDLDEPRTLVTERLRPSEVATGRRTTTQAWASRLHDRHPESAGLRWWSVLEASWLNVTLFDRAAGHLTVEDVQILTVEDGAVREAAAFLGLS